MKKIVTGLFVILSLTLFAEEVKSEKADKVKKEETKEVEVKTEETKKDEKVEGEEKKEENITIEEIPVSILNTGDTINLIEFTQGESRINIKNNILDSGEITKSTERDKFIFEKTDKHNILKIVFVDKNRNANQRKEQTILSFKNDEEIVSKFYYDVSGDRCKEMFIRTKYKNKHKIYIIQPSNSYFTEYFRVRKLESILMKNLNFNDDLKNEEIIKYLDGLLPQNYNHLNSWKRPNKKFRKFDLTKGHIVGYYFDQRLKNGKWKLAQAKILNFADGYVVKFKDGYYGKYIRDMEDKHFYLTAIFQGEYSSTDFFYYNGLYEERNNYGMQSSGYYKNNKKTGDW